MLEESASLLTSLGLSIISTYKNKKSVGTWTEYQSRIMTKQEIAQRFSGAYGIAIICGKVSGSLEVIDVDTKYDISGNLYERLCELIPKDLFSRLSVVCTRSGGYHFYYRCSTIQGNSKLARRPATAEEIKSNPHVKVLVLIETRGEGGYVVAPPTEGYTWIQGAPESIPSITEDERDTLHAAARSLNLYNEEPPREPHEIAGKNYTKSPFEDYNERGDVVGLLVKHGWKQLYEHNGRIKLRRPGKDEGSSGDFNVDKRWFCVFSTSTEFDAERAYKPAEVFCMLECGSDWSECAKRLRNEGFGTIRKTIDRAVEKVIRDAVDRGMEKDEIIDEVVQKRGISSSKARDAFSAFINNKGQTVQKFWEVKENKDGSFKINIIHDDFTEFLFREGGFQLYFYEPSSKEYRLIRVQDGLVEDSSIEDVKKFVMDYIDSLPGNFDGITQRDLRQSIKRGHSAYFSTGLIEFLPRSKVQFLTDDKDTCYFPFRNGVVKITKDTISLLNYGDIKKCIWKRQLINFDIRIEDLPDFKGKARCEYEHFLININGGDRDRLISCSSIIGYLLHKYKDPTRAFAVVLAEETENEASGGGTGKGIFVTALSKLTTLEQVDGKNFKIDKNFAFQRVKIDTRILAIQDVRQKVDFEGFYSIITEGITVEKKNMDELYIRYTDSPKILFTTNYSIPAEGNHAKRRQEVLPFSDHYSPDLTPADELGHRLFDDWDAGEWGAFYNYMFGCVQTYLDVGTVSVPITRSMKMKQIKLQFSEEFRDWFEHYTANGCSQWTGLKELHGEFISQYGIEERSYSIKRLKKAIETSCDLLGYGYKTEVIRDLNNRIAIKVDV